MTLQKNKRETLIKKMVLRPLCDGIRPSLCSDKGSTVFLGQQYQYSRGGRGGQGIEERGISQYSRGGEGVGGTSTVASTDLIKRHALIAPPPPAWDLGWGGRMGSSCQGQSRWGLASEARSSASTPSWRNQD